MKSSKIVLALLAAAAVFCGSCLDPVNQPDTTEQTRFWAQKMDGSGTMYQVSARKLVDGAHCVVWGESSANISAEQAANIANKYDQRIYGQMLDAFSMKNFDYTYEDDDEIEHMETFANIMEFAGWLVDEDDKLTILLLDIQDGFKNPDTDPYTAGYFTNRNFFPSRLEGQPTHSNIKSMIYIDTWPTLNSGWVAEEVAYQTLAHEFQHLINFVTTIIKRSDTDGYYYLMDTWINEGLSSHAEVLYSGASLQDRIDVFNKDYTGTIAKGNNFFVWGNHPEEPAAILDEYATVYLFFQWLYLQSGEDPALFHEIETSTNYDYRTVTNAAKDFIPNGGNWNTLLKTWLAANYIKDSNSVYGYKGDSELNKIKLKPAKGDRNKKVSLYPGEGVYSAITANSTLPAGSGTNIRYAGLGDTSVTDIATGQPYTGDVLLTFNGKTYSEYDDDEASTEDGYVTGSETEIHPAATDAARSPRAAARSAGFDGPRRLDARDLMGRQGDAGVLNKFRVKAKK